MRKKGIIYILVILLLWAAFAYLLRDSMLEGLVEKSLQVVAGARVEVDNFHFSLLNMECSWSRLQIANKNNPWYNIIETGRTSFDVETRPLFWRKIIIREMAVENAMSGTKRTTDGRIRKPSDEKKADGDGLVTRAKQALEEQLGELPVFDLKGLSKKINVDSLVDIDKLASVQGYEQLKVNADSSLDYWKSELQPDVYEKRVSELEQKVKSLKIDGVKDLTTLTNSLKNLNDIYTEVTSLKKEVNTKYSSVKTTYDTLQTQLKNMRQRLNQDIEQAQKLAKLQSIDIKDVSMLLFGEPAVAQFEKIMEYVSLARKYLPTAQKVTGKKKEEKTPRYRGQDIHFPFRYRYPEFLIKKIKFSAATAAGDTSKAYFLAGNLNGLTSQPAVFNNPTRFDVGVEKIGGRQYSILGVLDHITDEARDSLWLNANNVALGKIKLKESKYFPKSVTANEGDIVLSGFFIDNAVKMNADLDASSVKFAFNENANDQVSRIVKDVLSGLTTLNVNAKLTGKTKDYNLAMKSNVDGVLGTRIKGILDKNLQDARQQVDSYIRNQVDEKRADVENLIEKNKQTVMTEFENAREKVLEKYDEIEKKKKELEQRIEEEKEKLKNKGVDALKNLLN